MTTTDAYLPFNQRAFQHYYCSSRSGTGEELSSWPVYIAKNYDKFTSYIVSPVSRHPDNDHI